MSSGIRRQKKRWNQPLRLYDKERIDEENAFMEKYGLKNKSEAITIVVQTYEQSFLEPELKPEYIKKLDKIRKGKYIKFNSIEDLRKITS